MTMPDTAYLDTDDGERIAYKASPGIPTLVWCGGLASDMEGTKSVALHSWAVGQGAGYLRFDYFGHGQSSGAFTDGTISRWADDTVRVIDDLTEGSVILIGSSMGGWAALLAALDRPDRVRAMLLINAAPDFTEKLTYASWTDAQKRQLETKGVVYEPSDYGDPYAYSRALIEDGRARQILDAPIDLDVPIHLFQGKDDAVVPSDYVHRIAERLPDATVHLIPGGDHSLSRPEDITRYQSVLACWL